MHRFTDGKNQDWTIEINVSVVKRVRSLLGIDLMDVLGGDLLQRFARDPVLLVDTIYAACKPQADARGVSDEQFGEAMADGNVIEKASVAFMAGLLDFFQPGRREVLAKILAKVQETESKATERTLTALDNPAVDAAIERQIAEGEAALLSHLNSLGKSSGDAQESSELTPARSA